MKSDITGQVNGNLANANISATAEIAESKLAFDTSAGHDHDGTDSKRIAAEAKHYRKGLTLYGDDDDNVCVYPGTLEISDTLYTRTTVSGDIAIATAGNWVNGSSGTSQWIYVYAYVSSGAIAYKLSDEPPDLSDEDDNTAEFPLRYQVYTSVYYRCIGAVYQDAAGDLCWGHSGSEGMYVTNFDASNVCIMCGLGTGSDQELITLWTPKYARNVYGNQDTSPADGETLQEFMVTKEMLDGTWYSTLLDVMHSAAVHDWEDEGTAGCMKTVTAQSTSAAGHCDIHAMTDGKLFYFMATTDLV